jgi:4-diphosphocytidyl-2-C-methyl-D-erythritol kinase
LVPEIADILAALQASKPWLARMSGSGATCFALYETDQARDQAAQTIAQQFPQWWQMSGALR